MGLRNSSSTRPVVFLEGCGPLAIVIGVASELIKLVLFDQGHFANWREWYERREQFSSRRSGPDPRGQSEPRGRWPSRTNHECGYW